MMEYRKVILSAILIIFLALAILPFMGNWYISPISLINGKISEEQFFVFWQLRMPRILLAALAGGGLAVSGLVVQTLLRNPLATPYTLGVTSGSGLGAVIAIKSGLEIVIWGFSSIIIFSFAGALAAAWVIFVAAYRMRHFSTYMLILIGIILAYALGAVSLFIQFFSDWTETRQIVRWFMGGIEPVGYNQLVATAIFTLPPLLHIYKKKEEMNILLLGEEIAGSKGIDVKREIKVLFLDVTIVVAVVVSVTGPIGFVGIIIPHLMRLAIGPDNSKLIPLSFIGGGVFLMFCDTLGRVLAAPAELPVGIITAIAGAIFFIFLLYFKRDSLFTGR